MVKPILSLRWTSALSILSVRILRALIANKILHNEADAEAQVIASAIAAFQSNTERRRDLGPNPLDAVTVPWITIADSCSAFYLVPVTMALSNAVIADRYTPTQTQVSQCPTAATCVAGIDMEDADLMIVKS